MRKILQNIKTKWYKIYFMLAVIVCVFLYGTAVGFYKIFPFNILKNAEIAAIDWIDNFKHYTEIKPEKFLKPARYEGSGVVNYSPDKVNDGVTLITSFWDNSNGFNLVGMDGTILHKWRVSLNEIAPNTQKSVGDWDVDLHGAHLYPRFVKILHNAMTIVDFPESEALVC